MLINHQVLVKYKPHLTPCPLTILGNTVWNAADIKLELEINPMSCFTAAETLESFPQELTTLFHRLIADLVQRFRYKLLHEGSFLSLLASSHIN